MLCAKCNKDNPSDASFCEDCGAKLELICPACKAAVSPGARFCKKCGAALTANRPNAHPADRSEPPIKVITDADSESEAPDGERKTVTAMFADIKGSTALAEGLDPEAAHAIVDPVLRLMIEAVHRYEGYVVRSTGDGIFAVFGAPVAHEDHPQRALYGALRLQDGLKRYAARRREAGELPIEARVGVNTGEVVAYSVETDGKLEYRLVGHTANLASRMEALAPTGAIAISEDTRKLVEGYFALKSLGPTIVKGVSEPVNVYEVTGLGPLRTRLQRSAGRGLTKFVGREREMEALRHAAGQARSGHGQIVAAIAEPGVGKSRLYFEFKATSQSGWMVLEAFSVSHGKASAYLPVIDLLRNYFRIASEDDERTRREKVAGKIAILDRSLEDTLPYLFSLLGIVEGEDPLAQMDGQIKRRRTLEAIKRILLRESLNQPLMVIFEDLHWIDEATQEFLNRLADSIGTAKILLLVNYRPEYSHHWNSKTYYTQLRLDPLGKENAEEMLFALLGDGKDLVPLKRLIVERTEGTPFFMEEIVQSLVEDGVLQRNGAVKLVKSMNAVKVPATVQAILAARIDWLPAEEKELLQTLAVLGREFSFELVRRVTLESDDDLNRMLGALQLAEFIYEQPAPGDVEYIFKHALTQEVAYNSVLRERRQQLHGRTGAAKEQLYANSVEEHLTELADHYSRSANLDKAIAYLTRAAQQAIQRSASTGAIDQLATALRILKTLPETPQHDQQELTLQTMLGPLLIAMQGNAADEVAVAYERAIELGRKTGDNDQLFPALFGLRSVYLVRGEVLRAHELSQQLVSLADHEQDAAHLLEARLALGNTLHLQGALKLAHIQFEEALRFYDPKEHRSHAFLYGIDPGVFCLARLCWTLPLLGYMDQALEKTRAALALAREVSHLPSLVIALVNTSEVYLLRHETNLALESSGAAVTIADEHGFANLLGQATIFAGAALAQLGRTCEGIARMRQGLAGCQATGAVLFRPFYLRFLVNAYLKAGQLTEGLAVADEALALVSKTGERFYEAELLRLKGELKRPADLEGLIEAEDYFRKAIAVARSQEAKLWELRATTSLARLLALQGRRDEARPMLAAIFNWFTEGFDTADLKDAKVLLETLDPPAA